MEQQMVQNDFRQSASNGVREMVLAVVIAMVVAIPVTWAAIVFPNGLSILGLAALGCFALVAIIFVVQHFRRTPS
jgi:hypothetical protein